MKVLLRKQIDTDMVRIEQCVQNFTRQLADLMPIEVQGQQAQFRFFRRLLNFDDWRIAGKPQSTQYLDFQVVNSNIEAERDHLRVGDHFVRILTMKEAIAETRPLVLDRLFKIEGNFYVVTEWTPLSMSKARKEVDKRRRHFNMSKSGFVSQIGSDPAKTNQRDVLIDESKQADIENLGECLRALGDGQTLGDFSLTVVLYSTDLQTINQEMGEFAGVFTNADGALCSPRPTTSSMRSLPPCRAIMLRTSARCTCSTPTTPTSRFSSPSIRAKRPTRISAPSTSLSLETDNSHAVLPQPHNGEVAHTLILGMTGSGKSFLCNFLLTNAAEISAADLHLRHRRLVPVAHFEIFGGTYLNVGQESRDFTINPFSLPESKENLQFLFSFFRVLIEGNDKRYKLDFKEERKLWEAIERMYVVAARAADTLHVQPDHRRVERTVCSVGPRKASTDSCSTTWKTLSVILQVPDVQLRRLGRRAGSLGATALLRSPPGQQRDCQPSEAGDLQDCSCWTRHGSFIKNETIRSYIVQPLRRPGGNTTQR